MGQKQARGLLGAGFMGPQDMADRYGVSLATVYRWRSLGINLPPALKIGNAVRWRLSTVEAWEAKHESAEVA